MWWTQSQASKQGRFQKRAIRQLQNHTNRLIIISLLRASLKRTLFTTTAQLIPYKSALTDLRCRIARCSQSTTGFKIYARRFRRRIPRRPTHKWKCPLKRFNLTELPPRLSQIFLSSSTRRNILYRWSLAHKCTQLLTQPQGPIHTTGDLWVLMGHLSSTRGSVHTTVTTKTWSSNCGMKWRQSSRSGWVRLRS